MEIRRSSSSVHPVSLKTAALPKVTSVRAKMEADGTQTHAKQHKASTVQSSAEMEQVFLQMGVGFSSSAPIKDALSQTLPTSTKNALNAYQREHNQIQQHQRALLIAGIDFYA